MDHPSGSFPHLRPCPSWNYPINSPVFSESQHHNTREWMDERQRDRDRNLRSERSNRGHGWGASSSYMHQPGSFGFDNYGYVGSGHPNFQYGGGNKWRGGMKYYYDNQGRSYSRERIAPWGRDSRGEIPDQAIVVRGLALDVNEVDLLKEVTRYKLHPRDVRLVRRESGESSGVAVVEFQTLPDAVRWKDVTKGVLHFHGQKARLNYSLPKEVITIHRNAPAKRDRRDVKVQDEDSEQATPKAGETLDGIADDDWMCATCGSSNFRRREMCFKCNFPREDLRSSGPEALKQEGQPRTPGLHSSSLLFRNLDPQTTEARITEVLADLTTPPIKSLRVARDFITNISKGFCTLEFNSPTEATELHTLLLSMGEKFSIDGKQVMVSYARRPRTPMNRLVCKLHNRRERLEERLRDRDRGDKSRSDEDKSPKKHMGSSSDSYASDDGKNYSASQDSEEIPNCTIVVRGLMPSISKADLHKEVIKHGFQPRDVRLLRKKATGASRGFAFVEFESVEEATQWKELTQGALLFEGENRATLHYSIPMEVITLERNHASRQNWLCGTCGVSNFRQRIVCFQCNTPRLR